MVHRAAWNAPSDRFLVAFVLSRESSDVPHVPVFTMFCCVRTKLAPNMHECRQTTKIKSFCLPKSSPGASAGPKIEPEQPRSGEKVRRKRPRGLRKFFLVGANETALSEKARPVPPNSARGPEAPEGFLRNLRMNVLCMLYILYVVYAIYVRYI